jgi:putative transposase
LVLAYGAFILAKVSDNTLHDVRCLACGQGSSAFYPPWRLKRKKRAPPPAAEGTDDGATRTSEVDGEVKPIHLTYKYRLLPTRAQHEALARILEDQRQLYNAALQERIECYRKTGVGRSWIDQQKALTEWRNSDVDARSVPLNLQRWTLKRLDNAYRAFFARIKDRNGSGYPRYRGKGWWSSFGFREFKGISFDGTRIRFNGIPGALRVNVHRPLPEGKPLSCVFALDAKGWCICFQVKVFASAQRNLESAIGIDLGIKTLAALSNGILIPNPRPSRRAAKELRRRQRALARCKLGSTRRRKVKAQVTRLHASVRNVRATALHQISSMLVKEYDAIAVEALNTKSLMRTILSRDVQDASWGRLRKLLRYKAERAGAHFIEVDPKYTSQTCPDCGQIAAKTLAERTHKCDCGCVLDRDVAAARVILRRAVVGPWAHNVARYGERVTGKLTAISH